MTHSIRAIVAARDVVGRLPQRANGRDYVTDLGFGLALDPLENERLDQLTELKPGSRNEHSFYLTEGLETVLLAASEHGALAYIETDYFGGIGSQTAAVFRNGGVAMRASLPVGPKWWDRQTPINAALRMIGVLAADGKDEFDTLDLGRFRTFEHIGIMEEEEEEEDDLK